MEGNRRKRLEVLMNLSKGLDKIEKLIKFFKDNYREENLNDPEMIKAINMVKDLNSFNSEFNEKDMTLESIIQFLETAKKEQNDFIDKFMDYMDTKVLEE